MRIAEIFHSLQGEGMLTGIPSVFIRTSGCNLRCAWCDTPYASWHPEGPSLPLPAILDSVLAFQCPHAVLTGGEPMIASDIHELARELHDRRIHVTIETAGTIPPNGIHCDLASLSPKLANSTPPPSLAGHPWSSRHEASRLQPAVLAEWISHYPFQLKFVVASAADLTEIHDLLAQLPPVPPHQVLLMPEGRTPEETASRSAFVADTCKSHGFRYCHRLHLDLYGNTRGT